MKRVLLLFITAVVPACYGTYSLPFLGNIWTPGAPKQVPAEKIRIHAPAASYAVGDTFELRAELAEPDTLLPAFLWTSRSGNLSLSQEGSAVFKKRGEGEACVQVWYFYRLLENNARHVLKDATNRPTCTKLQGK